jgi:polyferredoxin
MLSLFLFRFWPVLIPVVVYWLWFKTHVNKAKKNDLPIPRFRDGPWYWLVLSSLLLGVLCFVGLGAATPSLKGKYIPPHMENGVLIPGHVEEAP